MQLQVLAALHPPGQFHIAYDLHHDQKLRSSCDQPLSDRFLSGVREHLLPCVGGLLRHHRQAEDNLDEHFALFLFLWSVDWVHHDGPNGQKLHLVVDFLHPDLHYGAPLSGHPLNALQVP